MRATEVAPTHEKKASYSFIYAKLNNSEDLRRKRDRHRGDERVFLLVDQNGQDDKNKKTPGEKTRGLFVLA